MAKPALGLLLFLTGLPQESPQWRVLPWNGFHGAVSLTFDDSDPSHLSVAIPELDRKKLRATFFVITSHIGNGGAWKKAAATGHEIASHSATHREPSKLKPGEEDAEVLGAARCLEQAFGRPVTSFAYPYSVITPELRARVQKVHLLARGGEGALVPANADPDWLNLTSQATTTEGSVETYRGWIDEAQEKSAWSIFMIHGLEGSGYTPIRRATLVEILDHLKQKDVWVAPMGEVGSYLRAQRTVEAAPSAGTPGGTRREWKVPPLCPKGILLKVKAASEDLEFVQNDAVLRPDPRGVCSLRFDEGSVVLRSRR